MRQHDPPPSHCADLATTSLPPLALSCTQHTTHCRSHSHSQAHTHADVSSLDRNPANAIPDPPAPDQPGLRHGPRGSPQAGARNNSPRKPGRGRVLGRLLVLCVLSALLPLPLLLSIPALSSLALLRGEPPLHLGLPLALLPTRSRRTQADLPALAGRHRSPPLPPPLPWHAGALTRAVLSPEARVARVVHLQDQLLLLVLTPCDAGPLLRALLRPATGSGTQAATSAAAAAQLPWRCAFSPGTPHETLSPLRGVAARGRVLHVRCPLPGRAHGPGSAVTLAVTDLDLPAESSAQWLHLLSTLDRQDPARQLAPACSPRHIEAEQRRGAVPTALWGWAVLAAARWGPVSSTEGRRSASLQVGRHDRRLPFASDAILARPEEPGYTARRLVLEAFPQAEGVYLFAEGLRWSRRGSNSTVPVGSITCLYGEHWKAPAVVGVPGHHKAVACPNPPPEVQQRIMHAPGLGGLGTGAGARGTPLIPLTLEDGEGVLPSAAYFQAGIPAPPPWRVSDPASFCAKAKAGSTSARQGGPRVPPGRKAVLEHHHTTVQGGSEARGIAAGESPTEEAVPTTKKHFLCSCTMVLNAAKFLHEWVHYHAWMGVEHFFVYDNNSDDDLQARALNLSLSIPHPTAWDPQSRRFDRRPRGKEGRGAAAGSGRRRVGVTVTPWPWLKNQQAGFSHCVLQAGPLCDWVMFTDVDEFAFPKIGTELKSRENVTSARRRLGPFLPRLLAWSQAKDCPKAMGQWEMLSLTMGASGQVRHPTAGVCTGYTCRLDTYGNKKVIIRPSATQLTLNHWVHQFGIDQSYHTSEWGNLAILYHYKFQAWPEYRARFARRVSSLTEDWNRPSLAGKLRADGVLVDNNGMPHPPDDWPQRFCETQDHTISDFVQVAFAFGGKKLPWAV